MGRPINLELNPKKNESQERFIKRFFKILSKEGVIEQYLEKTKFYKKPSEIKKNKKKKRKLINNKGRK